METGFSEDPPDDKAALKHSQKRSKVTGSQGENTDGGGNDTGELNSHSALVNTDSGHEVFAAGIRVHAKPETAFTFRQNVYSCRARIRNQFFEGNNLKLVLLLGGFSEHGGQSVFLH